MVLHVEYQADDETHLPQRVLAYHGMLALRFPERGVLSVVVYLRARAPKTPFVREVMPGPSAWQLTFRIQAKTVLLSLVNAGLLSVKETTAALGIHASHCRELARKLASHDVVESVVDKRQGQKQDYLVGPKQKAEIIQQLAARAITGQSTSSDVLAEVVNERTRAGVSARTVRWHIQKLGLTRIKQTLPMLLQTLKKNS